MHLQIKIQYAGTNVREEQIESIVHSEETSRGMWFVYNIHYFQRIRQSCTCQMGLYLFSANCTYAHIGIG